MVIERLLARTGGDFQARGHALAALLAVVTVALVTLVDLGGDAREALPGVDGPADADPGVLR
jgi:hypothetical protein